MFALLLAGCIKIEMKVNKDGSCDLKYEIRTEGMIGSDEVKTQLENSIKQANDEAGKNVAKLKGFKEKDGVITANISLSDISYMGGDAFFGKLSDFEKEYPGYLDELMEAKKGEYVSRDKIKGAGRLNVVRVSGVTAGSGDIIEFKVILPGTVKYISSNVTLVDSKTVNVNSGYGIILYERGGGAGWLVYVIVIAIVVVVLISVFGNKGRRKSSTVGPAVPVTETVPVGAAAPAAQAYSAKSAANHLTADEDFIYCPHCGTRLKAGAKFCSSCGGRVSE